MNSTDLKLTNLVVDHIHVRQRLTGVSTIGPTGATGPTGTTGPTGPTGATGPAIPLVFGQMQYDNTNTLLTSNSGERVDVSTAITPETTETEGDISSPSDGVFRIEKSGIYRVFVSYAADVPVTGSNDSYWKIVVSNETGEQLNNSVYRKAGESMENYQATGMFLLQLLENEELELQIEASSSSLRTLEMHSWQWIVELVSENDATVRTASVSPDRPKTP